MWWATEDETVRLTLEEHARTIAGEVLADSFVAGAGEDTPHSTRSEEFGVTFAFRKA